MEFRRGVVPLPINVMERKRPGTTSIGGDQAALVEFARGGEAGARTQDVPYFLRKRHSCSNSIIAKAGFQKGKSHYVGNRTQCMGLCH
jgi:hypothetical protein